MYKKLTMSDIAKDLGVSTVTVSKALSGKEGVSDEVRSRIILRASELGYEYHKAKNVETSGTGAIFVGIIIMDRFVSGDSFYSNILTALTKNLVSMNMIAITEIVERNDEKNCVLPACVRNAQVSALIMLGHMDEKYVDNVLAEGLPYVFMDDYLPHSKTNSVVADNLHGCYLMTKLLIEAGHKDIGFVGSYKATNSIMDRYLGYRKALYENNLNVRHDSILEDRDEDGDFIELSFPEKMPTAFVCNCDGIAFQLVNTLKEMGKRVPEDVSVVGFDDSIHASLSTPALTTFRIDMDAMVRDVVGILRKSMEDSDYYVGRVVVAGDIVRRDSVMAVNDK